MYIICLATEYDGTIAHNGVVDDSTLRALIDFKRSGRKLVLVTGRELPDLSRCFSRLDLFDRVVAENGALLYTPASKKEQPLAPEPPESFIERLRAAGVAPLSVGRSIVATWEPHEKIVLEAIRDLGLELQIVFNKGAVMVLPANVNKASGLKAALDDLGLSAHNVVAVGDAENDHAFLQASGFAVAVANALPAIKNEADLVTRGARGAGVSELIESLLARGVATFGAVEEHSAELLLPWGLGRAEPPRAEPDLRADGGRCRRRDLDASSQGARLFAVDEGGDQGRGALGRGSPGRGPRRAGRIATASPGGDRTALHSPGRLAEGRCGRLRLPGEGPCCPPS